MQDSFEPLVSSLERSQTHNDVDVDLLKRQLAQAEAAVSGQAAPSPGLQQRLVSVLCSWLRANEDLQDGACLRWAVRILARCLGQDSVADNIAIQKGLLSSLTSFLSKRTNDPALLRSSLEVMASLSVVECTDTIISRLETVRIIVDLVRNRKDDAALAEDAITSLAIMAKRTRHRRALSQSGGIAVLVEVLKLGLALPTLVVAVCRCLTNFAVKEDCCMAVLTNGGVAALMAAFDNCRPPANTKGGESMSHVDVRAIIARAIWTTASNCAEVRDALLSSGWLSSLAAVLQANPEHADMHEAALGIVRGLSRTAQYREDIVNLGFVPEAIRAMQRFSDNTGLLKEACGFFGNLASDPDIRAQLGECGVIQEVCRTLSRCKTREDQKVAKLALGALSNLATCEANREVMAAEQTAPLLLEAARLYMHNENVLEYAIGAISHLAVDDACNVELVKAGVAEALLLFLADNREDLQVVSKSLVALRRLVRFGAAAEGSGSPSVQVVRGGRANGFVGVNMVVEAMEAHIYDEIVVKEGALLLTSLAADPANVQAIVEVAMKPCTKALEVHQHEASVADALAGLLGSLPLEEDQAFARGGSLDVLGRTPFGGACGEALPAQGC